MNERRSVWQVWRKCFYLSDYAKWTDLRSVWKEEDFLAIMANDVVVKIKKVLLDIFLLNCGEFVGEMWGYVFVGQYLGWCKWLFGCSWFVDDWNNKKYVNRYIIIYRF